MAKTPEKVEFFLNDLLEKAKPAAEKEFKTLCGFAKSIGGPDMLESWDAAFYTEKLKKEKFDFDSEELKPYFKLENVIDGVFTIAGKLYDIKFEEINNIDKYHNDVKTYKVLDLNDNLVSIFYADFFPREGKRGGAWMTSFKDQRIVNGVNKRPHVSIVCNFTKPTETEPSLLTFQEVTTLFHEFGHALHGMLSEVKYESLSGTSVYWDFVELPSQVFENWCYEKEALDLFAKHYKTGEVIPENLIQKIKDTSNFMEGMQTLRQLNFGFLDMAWHNNNETNKIKSVGDFEFEVTKNTSLYPNNPETCSSTAFSHIFQGGYSSGYYSYKWAEVLDADAFEFFKEKGIFNKEVAKLFKDNILSKGGSEHPAILYKKFRGKDASVDALLKRAGLVG
jgi:peptidyl-dipeptidase Dcp